MSRLVSFVHHSRNSLRTVHLRITWVGFPVRLTRSCGQGSEKTLELRSLDKSVVGRYGKDTGGGISSSDRRREKGLVIRDVSGRS